jgi:hypothetical protein
MLIETTATEESRCRVSIDHQIRLGVEKRKSVPVGRKDSSSADYFIPNNIVRGWPPQNDMPYAALKAWKSL